MNILYLITNTTGDEIAITKAFEHFGHTVIRVYDGRWNAEQYDIEFDFLFFHHSTKLEEIAAVNIPKVFWCFDLMTDHPRRSKWVHTAVQTADLAFFTDGDCVKNYHDKSVRLMQGAQEIKIGTAQEEKHDITFAGTIGANRRGFFHDISKHFELHITNKVYGNAFADLIASSKIIIAPDAPIKPNYWSNRVYMVLGYGGFLLHPYIKELARQYEDKVDLVFYHDRKDLQSKIHYYLDSYNDEERKTIADCGMTRTNLEHTYTHRCEVILQTVKDRFSITT